MPVKLSDVIMQLKADGTLPRGVSSPGYFDAYTPVVFNQDVTQEVEGPSSEVSAATFKVLAAVHFGDRLCVVGGSSELGAWSVDHAVSMSWADGNQWHCTVNLPAGEHEFKFVVVKASGEAEWESCANRCLQATALGGAEYATHWGGEPLVLQQPVPATPAPTQPDPTPAPAATQLQRTYNACRDVLAMYGAGSVSSVDIGGIGWRSPAPSSAVTTDTLLDMIEAARLSKEPAVVTREDADFVRKLGLGACNLPSLQHLSSAPAPLLSSIRSHNVALHDGGLLDAGFATADSHAPHHSHRALAPVPAAGGGAQHHQGPAWALARGGAHPSVGGGFGAPAPSGRRRRVISEATANAMQAVLGLGGEQQDAAAALGSLSEPRQQGEEEQSCRQVAAQLLVDHLGLGASDVARRAVVVDSLGALAGGGFMPRHLGPVQYTSWLARRSDSEGIWHAAVRCALEPLAERMQ